MTIELARLENAATRKLGAQVRAEIIAALNSGQSVLVDFCEMTRVTPSFVDELLGKLVAEMGVAKFRERVTLAHIHPGVRPLVEFAVARRAKLVAA